MKTLHEAVNEEVNRRGVQINRMMATFGLVGRVESGEVYGVPVPTRAVYRYEASGVAGLRLGTVSPEDLDAALAALHPRASWSAQGNELEITIPMPGWVCLPVDPSLVQTSVVARS